MWIWEIPNCERGDRAAIVARAKRAGLTHVLVKVADGCSFHQKNKASYQGLVKMLKAAGIQAWVWQYVYGNRPSAEAIWGAHLAQECQADGFVIDAEQEYKGKPSAAEQYARTLKDHLEGTMPIALSSYYLPEWHSTFPWAQFLKHCDLHMPQIYWYQRDPVWAVRESLRQCARYNVPVFPTIGAYTTLYHRVGTMARAVEEIQAQGLDGFNCWSWQHMGATRWKWLEDYHAFDYLKLVDLDSESHCETVDCRLLVEGDYARGDVRPILEHFGRFVMPRLDEGKIYFRRPQGH